MTWIWTKQILTHETWQENNIAAIAIINKQRKGKLENKI